MARIADVMSLRLVSVRPDESVQLAISRMLEENVGSVAVCDESQRLVGIFTERDVLRLAGEGAGWSDVRMADVMTRRVLTVSPDDDIVAAASLMGERRIRHVPVVEGENVLGIVGMRDVMRTLVERLFREQDPQAREAARELLQRAPSSTAS
ncbi:MAG: CBS domain-containing protein [Actinobacteria bacterium]|nr:CBS domain-containing protein [Actinomycetota bacterium]